MNKTIFATRKQTECYNGTMLDTHCHLNFKAFADDVQLVAQAMAEQQTTSIVVGCDRNSSRTAIDLAQTFPNLWSAVGLHPIHVLDDPWDTAVMKDLALENRVVAIGEVGLDFYRYPEDVSQKAAYLAAQYKTFDGSIDLAKELNKPLIIHSRNAYDEIISVLKKHFMPDQAAYRGTVHCFMGNQAQATALLELGFCLGFTGIITYRDAAPELLAVAQNLPADRLLIETDAPYLTPEPYRSEGKKATNKIPRNSPLYVRAVAASLAELRGTTTEAIIALTETNGRTLFQIPEKTEVANG